MSAGDDVPSAFDELAEQFVARVRAGEAPDLEAYVRDHPELEADIRTLFPLLAMVEGAKADTQAEGRVDATADEPPPATIGDYAIVRELGRGGMGCVYEAMHERETVAIKLIHPHLLGDASYLDRFLREAELGTRVWSPHVVRTLAAGTTDDRRPYLVMEYVEGQNLRDLLDEVGTVPERLRRHIGACVAEGLAAIHEQEIVHRDVKPENVVITTDEEVKLMDLGVALVQDAATRLTQTGAFVGSLLYAAPEQMRGGPIGPEADLYALGLLLFELATGEHPLRVVDGGGPGPLAAVDAPSPQERNPRVSPFFDEVVKSLLKLDPAERLGDAAAVAEILSAGERSAWWQAQQRPDQAWGARVGYDPLAGHVPFVGRAAELDVLEQAFAKVRKGHARVVAIEGEAGLGKSRLVREWLRAAVRATGMHAVVATHDPEGDAYAIPPLARAFGELLGPAAPVARLAALLGPSAGLAEAYGRYLRAEQAGPYGAGLPATAVTTASVRLARGLAREGPYILVMEDLHFASARARDLCLQVARGLQDHPVLVVMTSRPETSRDPFDAILGWPHAQTLALEPLTDAACRDLLAELSIGETAGRELGDLLRRAEGNPLYLVELARSLLDKARVEDTDESEASGTASDPRATSAEVDVPETLRGMLESRLGALEDEQRELLSLAACVGTEFDPVLVADALEASRMRTLKELGRIERNHALIESTGRSYRFAHHLVQETLYAELHDALRETYHGAVARAFAARENKAGAPPEELPGPLATTIAYHALRGEDPEPGIRMAPRALQFLWESLDTQGEHEIAAALLALGDRLDAPLRARALLHLANAALESEPSTVVLGHVEEALTLLGDAPEPFVAPRLHSMRAFLWRGLGRYDDALVEYDRALALVRDAGDPAYEAQVLRGRGGVLRQLGRDDESLAAIKQSLQTALDCGSIEEECSARNSLAIRLVAIGAHTIALDMYDGAMASARACGKRSTECTVLNNMARTLLLLGRAEEAAQRNEESLAVAREMGHIQLEARALSERAAIREIGGRYAEAAADQEAAARMAEAKEWWEEARASRLLYAELLFDSGALDGAARQLDRAAEHHARAPGHAFARALSLARAELAAVTGDAEGVVAHLRGAPPDARVTEPHGEGLRVSFSRARLGLYAGDDAACRAHAEAMLAALAERENRMDLPRGHALAALACWRQGAATEARAHAEAAVALGAETGFPWPALLGDAILVALGIEDPLAMRLRLEAEGDRMPWWARASAWHALHAATGAEADLRQAVGAIAPAEGDPSVLQTVALFRAIAGRDTA